MKAKIACLGTELTEGHIRDKNGQFLAALLTRSGIEMLSTLFLPDGEALQRSLSDYLSYGDLFVLTGGLGPTLDDQTREVVATLAGVKLCYHAHIEEKMIALYGSNRSDNNSRQAFIPEGFQILSNPVGSADGFCGCIGQKKLIILPGPPYELSKTIENNLDLLEAFLGTPLFWEEEEESEFMTTLTTWLIPESLLDAALVEFVKEWGFADSGLCWGTRTISGGVVLYFRGATKKIQEQFVSCLEKQLGRLYCQRGEMSIEKRLIARLGNRAKISGAESCTGGLVSARLTEVSGASSLFQSAWVVYSDEMKERLLGVERELLEQFSSVSEPVVRQMLQGVFAQADCDYAYAVSGYAGPKREGMEEPVGKVVIGVGNRKQLFVKTFHFHGSRENIRDKSCGVILHLLDLIASEELSKELFEKGIEYRKKIR